MAGLALELFRRALGAVHEPFLVQVEIIGEMLLGHDILH
jgi:hypothetical protein